MLPLEEFQHTFDRLLQRLPPGWEARAVETRAFARARQIKSPRALLRAVFAYS